MGNAMPPCRSGCADCAAAEAKGSRRCDGERRLRPIRPARSVFAADRELVLDDDAHADGLQVTQAALP